MESKAGSKILFCRRLYRMNAATSDASSTECDEKQKSLAEGVGQGSPAHGERSST
jgi:hypothetical protein